MSSVPKASTHQVPNSNPVIISVSPQHSTVPIYVQSTCTQTSIYVQSTYTQTPIIPQNVAPVSHRYGLMILIFQY